jgi:hypothetical protein
MLSRILIYKNNELLGEYLVGKDYEANLQINSFKEIMKFFDDYNMDYYERYEDIDKEITDSFDDPLKETTFEETSPDKENVLFVFKVSACNAEVALDANPVNVEADTSPFTVIGVENVTSDPESEIDESLTEDEVTNLLIFPTVPTPPDIGKNKDNINNTPRTNETTSQGFDLNADKYFPKLIVISSLFFFSVIFCSNKGSLKTL